MKICTNKHALTSTLTALVTLCLSVAVQSAEFAGVIGRTAADSIAHWPGDVRAPQDAPNVIVWLMDDVGFAHAGSFGGLVDTPHLDALASNGLRFTNFHATALCSPSRAALLTGRNHHAVGVGAHAATAAGFPGYNARIPRSAASIARLLRDAGYATYAAGKWDQLPFEHTSALGPFDYWPSGQGFEHFYGFLSFDNHHFQPVLWSDHTPVAPPATGQDYHLTADLADRAIHWIAQHAARPERPFFLYWSTGAVHAPHHAPQAYLEKYRGRFQGGWHAARHEILGRQKRLGIIPADASLPPWPDNVPRWDTLTPDEQQIAARQMEAFAAMLDHADHEFGRMVDVLREAGLLDNTVIIVVSDNGASAEGGPAGTFNELLNGKVDWSENRAFLDDWGGPSTYPHYSAAWAAAGNTPFRYYKQSAHEGGARVPFWIHWPRGIAQGGGVRHQFHHVNDIVPTLLDIIGIAVPPEVDGVTQQRLDGRSFRYAFEDADAPTNRKAQYFELWGNRGIWADGWKAVVLERPEPWNTQDRRRPVDLESAHWALYHLAEDFNELHDLSAEHPKKLAELKTLFDREARRNNVYPIGPDFFAHSTAQMRAVLAEREGRFTYADGAARIPAALAPPIHMMPFDAEATLNDCHRAQEGVIFAFGGSNGGLALLLEDRRPVLVFNASGREVHRVPSSRRLPCGQQSTIGIALRRAQAGGARVNLRLGDTEVASGSFGGWGSYYPLHETFDIGRDWGSPVAGGPTADTPMPAGVIDSVSFNIRRVTEASGTTR